MSDKIAAHRRHFLGAVINKVLGTTHRRKGRQGVCSGGLKLNVKENQEETSMRKLLIYTVLAVVVLLVIVQFGPSVLFGG